ncbi:MAG: hypothetical protein M3154_05825, partial [Candidatus Eremiobacteraeota bacterium]|nr:hypothetical protein [Candidatus Eremiobacteraeota bacterium]
MHANRGGYANRASHANANAFHATSPDVTLTLRQAQGSKGAPRPRHRTPLKPPDPLLLGPVAFLVALGLVMVFSSSSAIAY